MKKYIIFLLLLYNYTYAQNTYFSDTLDNSNQSASGVSVQLLNNNQYAVKKYTPSYPQLSYIYTNSTGDKLSTKDWNITNKIFLPSCKDTKLKNGNWLIAGWAQTIGIVDNYNCLITMNKRLEDTVQTKIFKFNYQNIPRQSAIDDITMCQDSTSLWILGEGDIGIASSYSTIVSRVDTNFNTLSQNWILYGTASYRPEKVLARQNNRCIISGVCATNNGWGWDDIRVCGIDDNGLRWSKIYGGSLKRDAFTYLFEGRSDTTFWLVYTEGRTDTLPGAGQYPATRVRAVLLSDNGTELMSKYLGHTQWIFTYHQIALPLADGGYLFGFYKRDYHAIFQKYSANFELQWESEPPFPNMPSNYPYINPLHASELPNGDFICTGVFDDGVSPSYMIWLGKMDSTGCWYDAGCSPTPTLPRGEGDVQVRVYPNPAHDILNIAIADFQNKTVVITNTLGIEQKIISLQSESTTLSISNFSNGIYYVSIYENNRLLGSRKLVVQHE